MAALERQSPRLNVNRAPAVCPKSSLFSHSHTHPRTSHEYRRTGRRRGHTRHHRSAKRAGVQTKPPPHKTGSHVSPLLRNSFHPTRQHRWRSAASPCFPPIPSYPRAAPVSCSHCDCTTRSLNQYCGWPAYVTTRSRRRRPTETFDLRKGRQRMRVPSHHHPSVLRSMPQPLPCLKTGAAAFSLSPLLQILLLARCRPCSPPLMSDDPALPCRPPTPKS
ncbi:hypothetical protein CALVIDRAFT_307295 [Calocera viscosa TUFC12733]|uniref:Uncharacterized protein n=1 Tax=Calocera viscosa (strain TUFC12733) TaxID=1330018 RepID=A0A167IBM2_CALVF|nr:hypothetical protein CALVIDRAFT_307295 [Calocera viscosa TUFC12733]